jgi:serine protease inhibitor ecotin
MLIADTLHALCANRMPIVVYGVDGVEVRYRV